MAYATEPGIGVWTAADLVERFGPIPLDRVRFDPLPGLATEQDVVEIRDHEDRLYELVDGVLVEKDMGTYESYLAVLIARFLGNFVSQRDLGIVLGADGMMRLAPGLVRIPDVSFLSWERLPGRAIPDQPIADLVPDLAVEVISRGNTREEMQGKLSEYFGAGVRLVWYVYPRPQPEVWVHRAPGQFTVLTAEQVLDGGDVLPGFRLELATLFAARPGAPSA